MPKIIGKIIGVQDAREGVGSGGRRWVTRSYVIEDETHPREGIIATTFNTGHMQQVGRQTHGELLVEVEYTPTLRHWDGIRSDGTRGEARWSQSNEIYSFRILKGAAADAQAQAEVRAEDVRTAPQAEDQPAEDDDDLPF